MEFIEFFILICKKWLFWYGSESFGKGSESFGIGSELFWRMTHSYYCFNFFLSDFHFVPESWVLIELGSMGSVPEIQF